jgi:hypothetical protein
MASGEMSAAEFLAFNNAWMSAVLPFLCDGGLFGTFIDWRGYPAVFTAASRLTLDPINLIVWTKTNAGMGSLYRSKSWVGVRAMGCRAARRARMMPGAR